MTRFIGLGQLRKLGILGMNRRNIEFIARYNPRSLYPLVDDKLKTKVLARKYGIPVPELYFSMREQHRVRDLAGLLENLEGFAVKPARGSGGKGILIIKESGPNAYIKSSGAAITLNDLKRHVSNILGGLYSLAGTPDAAIVEELIHCDDIFADYSWEGVPDIRIIVFQGYPVMAMLRLTTRVSDGKANLHQGAVGVGLDISDGKIINAVQYSRPIERHPDTNKAFDLVRVPGWREILRLASCCYEMTGLGYIGADIVLDKKRGPVLLELNARPGLNIQLANGGGLVPRLRVVEDLKKKHAAPEDRVRFAVETFWRMRPCGNES